MSLTVIAYPLRNGIPLCCFTAGLMILPLSCATHYYFAQSRLLGMFLQYKPFEPEHNVQYFEAAVLFPILG